MSGKSARRKGHQWERDVARMFTEAMGVKCRRGMQYRSGGDSPDVEAPIFWIECKAGARPPIRGALDQAVMHATPTDIPIAVIKEDRRPPFVVCRLDDFLTLAADAMAARGEGGEHE